MCASVCVCVFDLVMYLMVKSDLRERVGVETGVGVGNLHFRVQELQFCWREEVRHHN